MNRLNTQLDSLNFEVDDLFGNSVIGKLFKNHNCSIAVVYDFKGNLVDTQAFGKDGFEIKEKGGS